MREKFALQDTHKCPDLLMGEARMFMAIVDCGTGPVVLRLCVWVNGYRFNEDTFQSEPYGPARWVFEMMPAGKQGKKAPAKLRGQGDTGIPVTFDGAWEIITASGLPSHYSFV
jgi:hypothetical protein